MSESADEEAVLSLLGQGLVREILAETSEEAKSVRELAETCDVARSTVYRRVEELLAHDLVRERTAIEPDGSHHSVYEAAVDHVDVDVEGGRVAVSLTARESAAERFTRIWTDIRET